MKRIKINEILLLSKIEKKARKITFDPKITVVKGTNHVGKSSLIKSIYYTFGANPEIMHPMWKKAEVISVIKFSVEEKKYSILRRNKSYIVIDHNNNKINTFESVTKELGPYLASVFNIKIKISDKENQFVTPPPAYFLLPFYIDQDSGWKKNWSSFSNLTQLQKNWKRDIAYFHTGIKPNEYYEIKSKIDMYLLKNSNLTFEKEMTRGVLRKITDHIDQNLINIDLDIFKREIDDLVSSYQKLNIQSEKLKEKIVDLKNRKMNVETQISVVEHTMKELRDDYEFALKEDDTIECPTCGTEYENSFTERFSIAKDEERCRDLLIEMMIELREIEQQMDKEYEEFYQQNTLIQDIKEALQKKQDEIKLKDIIQNEGKKEIREIVDIEIENINKEIIENGNKVEGLREELKKYEDKEREKTIKKTYKDYMRNYLDKLDVNTIPERSYSTVYSNIKESGSGLPRALLAYYISFLNTVHKYSSSVFFPIVIDSPNQQDQDEDHLSKIIDLILEEQPEDTQLILGTVNLPEKVKVNGKIIELTDKYSLLQEKEYESILKEINQILELSVNKNKI